MPNIVRSGLYVFILLGWAAGGFAEEPDPAALVRRAREQESWIDRAQSLQLKAEIRWERTPLGLEQRRRELRTQFPDSDLSKFRDLEANTSQIVELAFDKKRIRLRIEDVGDSEDLRIWDGKRFILHNRYDLAPDRSGYLINREPEQWLYWLVWTNFYNFRSGAHEFWWMNPKRLAEWKAHEGKPEDFAYEGTAQFHGTKCHVVSRWESWTTLYVAVDDGRLRGMRTGAQSTQRLERSYIDLLRRKGHQVRDENEAGRVLGAIPKAELAAICRVGASEMTRLIDPCTEFWLSDYKEVAPGCWLPMTQGVSFISVDDKGDAFESARNELEILDAKVNERLPATLFAVEFKEGERINDQTAEPPVTYRYKETFTPEEWAKIVAEGKERASRDLARQKRQAALLGQAAFDFPAEATWLNSKRLTKSDLNGKVIILDFWAEWCGPCRNDLPALAALHKKQGKDIIIIGVHPPGSELSAIEKMMKEFELGYPICVDVTAPDGATAWGSLFHAYGVDRIPHSVVIDKQGRIAATGALGEVLRRAVELAGRGL